MRAKDVVPDRQVWLQVLITLAQLGFLGLLVGLPFTASRLDVLWLSILTSTLGMAAWIKFGPRPAQGLRAGALCLLGMTLLLPLFAFWVILGIVTMLD